MKILNILLTLSMLACPIALFSQKNGELTFEDYQLINSKETGLPEFKDDDPMLKLKLEQLDYINKSRKKHQAQLLKLDILASRVANKMAYEAASQNFEGHFNLRGDKPYHRYAFAGGNDHVTENAASLSYDLIPGTSNKDKLTYMQQLHDAFMAERAPNDGHKKTCIQPDHNFVGIGFAIHNNEIRYYEEYIDRYLTFGEFPTSVAPNTEITIPVKTISPNQHVYALISYFDPFPKPMSAGKISRIKQYEDYTNHKHIMMPPWEIPKKDQTGFHPLKVTVAAKGLYYLQIFISDKPYKSGGASTDGKICASGIVIKVE